jgi:hypothetical protein
MVILPWPAVVGTDAGVVAVGLRVWHAGADQFLDRQLSVAT